MMAKTGSKNRTHKPGGLSNVELAQIQSMLETHTDEEISKIVNRTTTVINKVRAKTPALIAYSNRKDYITVLHSKHYWKNLTQQLTSDELGYFENEWGAYAVQFQELTHTDELTLLDTIILTIELNRIQIEKKQLIDEINDTQKLLDAELELGDQQDPQLTRAYRDTLSGLRSAQPTLSKRYLETQYRKDEKFKQLKATREQRYKSIEESKKNIFELLKQLDTIQSRKKENRMLSLMVDATRKEKIRLMEQSEFADGTVDSCLLSVDTINYLDETYPTEDKPG